jgi:Holliday junction resolvasome RuvABC ATP-dependent DNA helicase subunit
VYDQQATGREKELNWLRNTPGDLLLAGQPGLGKTFLFQVLVKEGKGLFVSTSDLTQITEGIREFEPEILFVDDDSCFNSAIKASLIAIDFIFSYNVMYSF